MSSTPDPLAFRAQFPVLERFAYLNAGTEGPVPARAAEAVHRRVELETAEGRAGMSYFRPLLDQAEQLRAAYAAVLGCKPEELALTGSTTDGVNTVISGLDLGPGDEIVTSDEEHPGLLAPLGRARRRHGVTVRVVPFTELATAVSPKTRLIACSHVSWVNGKIVDAAALAATGVPVLLDGAQAAGAVPVDVQALGCAFYAASGQKWMCGPEGSGCLFVRSDQLDQLLVPWPGYGSLAGPEHALALEPKEGVARLDHGFPVGLRSTAALASLEVLNEAGLLWVQDRAATLAALLAERLAASGLDVAPRGRSTLVSWNAPEEDVERLAAHDLLVRSLPGRGLLRASVGAWNSEAELDQLVELASATA
jgi:L-cysteine/cystine lyase